MHSIVTRRYKTRWFRNVADTYSDDNKQVVIQDVTCFNTGMDSMNKEYEPDWDQPSLHSHVATAEHKAAPVGAKQIVTIRLDVDMLEWFKAAGPGYQTRINQVLREHMDAQRAAELEGN
jgi:uncharacterized protein (DUF4415 family)